MECFNRDLTKENIVSTVAIVRPNRIDNCIVKFAVFSFVCRDAVLPG